MPPALLAVKITCPPPRPGWVVRERLLERLNLALNYRLTLLSAPAGYGKTSLLSAWAEKCGVPLAWISLDEGDSDPARFLAYVSAALRPFLPGHPNLPVGTAPVLPVAVPSQEELLNEIARIPHPVVLVLDDYHRVQAQAVHERLTALLEHLPSTAHLVIATRADPPLRLARLRARGDLLELRLSELRFNLVEAETLFNQKMQFNLTGEQVGALNARTEGWIAGLQLAALSLQEQPDRAEFIRTFSGSQRFVLDYLVEEVLQHEPALVQSFLLQTSLLDRLNGALCQAVSGVEDSQTLLEELERRNLFLIPMDNERSWYRYHHLFGDLLFKRLCASAPRMLPELHRRAAAWYEVNGFSSDAIQHYLEAGEFEHAADLMTAAAEITLMRSEIGTFRGWVTRLPEGVLRSRPDLTLYYAWTQILADASIEEVEGRLASIDAHLPGIQEKTAVLRGYLAYLRGDLRSAVKWLRGALEGLPVQENVFRNTAGWLLSFSHVWTGDFAAGAQALEEVALSSRQSGDYLIAAGALCQLAELHLRQAQLHAAAEDYQRALAISTDANGRHLPVAARPLLGLSELAREKNELESAERLLDEGIALANRLRISLGMNGYITLARIRQARGDTSGADLALQQAWQMAESTRSTQADDIAVGIVRAGLQIARGELEEAGAWVRERGLDAPFNPADLDQSDDTYKFHLYKYELLVLARWLTARGKPEQARQILEAVIVRMQAQGRTRLELEACLLNALAWQHSGSTTQALVWLEKTLRLAEPQGYVRLFVDEGEPMARLLAEAARRGFAPAYIQRLLAAWGGEQPAAAPLPAAHGSGLIEELSPRELELLRLIAEGHPNQAIAGRLYISLATVKWHTGHILAKLQVKNRTQAVAKARTLGLL